MPTLFVATNGLSIWTSTDLGITLARMPTKYGHVQRKPCMVAVGNTNRVDGRIG